MCRWIDIDTYVVFESGQHGASSWGPSGYFMAVFSFPEHERATCEEREREGCPIFVRRNLCILNGT